MNVRIAMALLTLSGAAPMPRDVKTLVDRMQGFYETTRDFQARFHQDYTYKAFKRKQSSDGRVSFQKPGKMRWEYLTPGKRTFVLSGEKVYAYDPEAATVTVGKLATNQLSASVTFLFGKGKLSDEFSIEKTACADCRGILLTLTPLKPDGRFREVRFEVDPKTAQVLVSTVIDPDGSENTIRFLDLKSNVGLKPEDFTLHYPASTQVIDLTQAK